MLEARGFFPPFCRVCGWPSRYHALLVVSKLYGPLLVDLEAPNGTFIDGRRLEPLKGAKLNDGAVRPPANLSSIPFFLESLMPRKVRRVEGSKCMASISLNHQLVSCVSQEVSLGTSTRRYRFRVEQDLEGRKQVGTHVYATQLPICPRRDMPLKPPLPPKTYAKPTRTRRLSSCR